PLSRLVCPLFFSSRRRHTSWPRDWSSDVCSSDLERAEDLDVDAELRDPAHDLGADGVQRGLDDKQAQRHDQDDDVASRVEVPAEIGRASCRERGGAAKVTGAPREEMRTRASLNGE